MMLNTYEHGYSDGIRGRQRVYGSEAYRAGWRAGADYRVKERQVTLFAASVVVFALAMVFAVQVASAVARMPV